MELDTKILWIDLEMTGLNVQKSKILEVASILTDGQLNVIAEGPQIAINYADSVFETMEEWSFNTHTKNGLIEKCKNSKVTLEMTEKMMIEFCKKHFEKGTVPIAGNTIHNDKLFLQMYMPNLNNYLHYRIIDVSSIGELCRRWYPDIYQNQPPKSRDHLALSDIRSSIEELKYYRKHIFANGSKLS